MWTQVGWGHGLRHALRPPLLCQQITSKRFKQSSLLFVSLMPAFTQFLHRGWDAGPSASLASPSNRAAIFLAIAKIDV